MLKITSSVYVLLVVLATETVAKPGRSGNLDGCLIIEVAAIVGESTTLTCYSTLNSSVDWPNDVLNTEELHFEDVVFVNQTFVQLDNESKCTHIRHLNGSQTVFITNISSSDAGLYRCTEDGGGLVSKHCVRLTVRESESAVNCQSADISTMQANSTGDCAVTNYLILVIVVTCIVLCGVRVYRTVQKRYSRTTMDQQTPATAREHDPAQKPSATKELCELLRPVDESDRQKLLVNDNDEQVNKLCYVVELNNNYDLVDLSGKLTTHKLR